MTPNAKDTLNDILTRYKNGDTDQETAGRIIEDLFKREPVNYKRHYSGSPEVAPDKLVAAPQKGQTIGLSGFSDQNGTYKVLEAEPGKNGSISLNLQRVEAPQS